MKKMKAYTWCNGGLSPGLVLAAQFGRKKEPSLILGQASPGSHYEALSLHRDRPPKITNFKVNECDLCFVPITHRSSFYLLEESQSEGVIVRVNTFMPGHGVGGDSFCEVFSGKPKLRTSGRVFEEFFHEDSLWEMQAGDVLRVKGCLSHGASYAIWVDEKMEIHTACFREYVARKAADNFHNDIERIQDPASVYSWRAGNLSAGVVLKENDFNRFLVLGDGPFAEFLPVIWSVNNVLKSASVIDLSGQKDFVLGLVSCARLKMDNFLVYVSTEGFKAKNSKGSISVLKGNPEIVLSVKRGEDFDDSLVLMREGDAICVSPQGDNSMISYVIFVSEGKITQEQSLYFLRHDFEESSDFWLEKGWSLRTTLPSTWQGQVIDCYDWEYDKYLSARYGLACYNASLKSRGVFKGLSGHAIILQDKNSGEEFLCLCDFVSLSFNNREPRKPDKVAEDDRADRKQKTEALLEQVKEFYDSDLFPACSESLQKKVKEAALYSYLDKRPIYGPHEKKSASLSGDGSLLDYCRYLRNLMVEISEAKEKIVSRKQIIKNQKKKGRPEVTTVTSVMHSGQMAEALKKAGLAK